MQKSVAIVQLTVIVITQRKYFQFNSLKFLIDQLGQFSWNLISDSNNSRNYYSEIERDPKIRII